METPDKIGRKLKSAPIAMARREGRHYNSNIWRRTCPTPTVEDRFPIEDNEKNHYAKLELDCERRIANDKFLFYQPLYFGDFLVCCWAQCEMLRTTASATPTSHDGLQPNIYGMAIYENGAIIDPTTDRRFRKRVQNWRRSGTSWPQCKLTSADISELVEAIRMATDSEIAEDEGRTNRWEARQASEN